MAPRTLSGYLWPGIGTVEALAPGVYIDSVGNVHFHVTQILEALGAEDSPGNRAIAAKTLVQETSRAVARLPQDAGVA